MFSQKNIAKYPCIIPVIHPYLEHWSFLILNENLISDPLLHRLMEDKSNEGVTSCFHEYKKLSLLPFLPIALFDTASNQQVFIKFIVKKGLHGSNWPKVFATYCITQANYAASSDTRHK